MMTSGNNMSTLIAMLLNGSLGSNISNFENNSQCHPREIKPPYLIVCQKFMKQSAFLELLVKGKEFSGQGRS